MAETNTLREAAKQLDADMPSIGYVRRLEALERAMRLAIEATHEYSRSCDCKDCDLVPECYDQIAACIKLAIKKESAQK
jgi:hypothetical protein